MSRTARDSETALLLDLLAEAFERKSWHGTNLRGSFRGMTAAEAAWRAGEGRPNAWELALHTAYWKYVVRRKLTGEKRGSFALEGSNWFRRPAGAPEEAAWMLATKRHIRSVWVTPPDFLNRGLSTELRVDLAADGAVIGEPEVVRSSGDPFADDNAVRALLKASPLPAPPQAGRRTFIFEPEERS